MTSTIRTAADVQQEIDEVQQAIAATEARQTELEETIGANFGADTSALEEEHSQLTARLRGAAHRLKALEGELPAARMQDAAHAYRVAWELELEARQKIAALNPHIAELQQEIAAFREEQRVIEEPIHKHKSRRQTVQGSVHGLPWGSRFLDIDDEFKKKIRQLEGEST